jgi:hypothetical protein
MPYMKHPMKVLLFLLLWAIVFSSQGQDTVTSGRVVVKPAYLSSMLPNKSRTWLRNADSIFSENAALKAQNDSLLLLINEEVEKAAGITSELTRAKENIENLKNELQESKGDQLQVSHTSSILLIFNIIAGIILLITLFWIYMRRKHPEAEEEEPVAIKSNHVNGKDTMETRMERVEKLGRLRDKGLLTEEEFQVQKKQILE